MVTRLGVAVFKAMKIVQVVTAKSWSARGALDKKIVSIHSVLH